MIPEKNNIEVFEPLIEFFNDKVILTRRTNEKYWYRLDILAFLKYVSDIALNELFFGYGDMSDIQRYYKLFNEHELTQMLGIEEKMFFNPKFFLKKALGVGLYKKLHWTN